MKTQKYDESWMPKWAAKFPIRWIFGLSSILTGPVLLQTYSIALRDKHGEEWVFWVSMVIAIVGIWILPLRWGWRLLFSVAYLPLGFVTQLFYAFWFTCEYHNNCL